VRKQKIPAHFVILLFWFWPAIIGGGRPFPPDGAGRPRFGLLCELQSAAGGAFCVLGKLALPCLIFWRPAEALAL